MSGAAGGCTCTCGLPNCASLKRRPRVNGVTEHGTESGYRMGCHCDECTRAGNLRHVHNNRITQAVAVKSGDEWTSAELETATRTDLTAREAALMLGRTLRAVRNIRYKCRHDPKFINLLGTGVI